MPLEDQSGYGGYGGMGSRLAPLLLIAATMGP